MPVTLQPGVSTRIVDESLFTDPDTFFTIEGVIARIVDYMLYELLDHKSLMMFYGLFDAAGKGQLYAECWECKCLVFSHIEFNKPTRWFIARMLVSGITVEEL